MSRLLASEMRNITTPQVVLILGMSTLICTVIIWLAIIGKDPVDIFTGLAPILLGVAGFFGWAKVSELKRGVDEVKEQGNGRLTKLQDDNQALRDDNKVLHEKVAALSLLIKSPEEK